jgi:FkbM family methyltransferase
MRNLALSHRARNCLRAAVVEVVPAQPGSNLLAMHLKMLFSAYEISCVLDVGAHRGEYGLWLRRNGYHGDIVSFEPVRANFQDLARVAAGDPRWHCVGYALGAENRVASINVTSHTVFSSFHTPNAAARTIFGQGPTVERSEEVEIRRLDTVLDTLPVNFGKDRTYLKIDAQGWDLEVIAGAEGVLDRVIALQTEVAIQTIYEGMPAVADSLAAIAERGFVPSGFFPVDLDQRLAVVELDLVAVRRAD